MLRGRALSELREGLRRLGAEQMLAETAREIEALVARTDLEELKRGYQETFEASGGLRCSPNETTHTTETPQHGLTRTFELADVAGFYRAFGVEVRPETERADHITAELEFMHLLAVKEAHAEQEEGPGEHVEICHSAARAFMHDHLGRWVPRFAALVEERAAHPFYAAAGRLLGGFLALEASRLSPN
jgi:TorA maturation chaperone TorD